MLLFVLLFIGALASAQEIPKSQPPLWSGKPDVAAFEKIEDGRLTAAQQSIDRLVAVKGPRTIVTILDPRLDIVTLACGTGFPSTSITTPRILRAGAVWSRMS